MHIIDEMKHKWAKNSRQALAQRQVIKTTEELSQANKSLLREGKNAVGTPLSASKGWKRLNGAQAAVFPKRQHPPSRHIAALAAGGHGCCGGQFPLWKSAEMAA